MYIFHIIEKTSKNAAYIFRRFEKCQKVQEGKGVPKHLFGEITECFLDFFRHFIHNYAIKSSIH